MTLWNVSTVMAPNLFLARGRPPKLPKGEKQLVEAAAEVVCMMVQYQDLLWTVSDGNDSKPRAGCASWFPPLCALLAPLSTPCYLAWTPCFLPPVGGLPAQRPVFLPYLQV